MNPKTIRLESLRLAAGLDPGNAEEMVREADLLTTFILQGRKLEFQDLRDAIAKQTQLHDNKPMHWALASEPVPADTASPKSHAYRRKSSKAAQLPTKRKWTRKT